MFRTIDVQGHYKNSIDHVLHSEAVHTTLMELGYDGNQVLRLLLMSRNRGQVVRAANSIALAFTASAKGLYALWVVAAEWPE